MTLRLYPFQNTARNDATPQVSTSFPIEEQRSRTVFPLPRGAIPGTGLLQSDPPLESVQIEAVQLSADEGIFLSRHTRAESLGGPTDKPIEIYLQTLNAEYLSSVEFARVLGVLPSQRLLIELVAPRRQRVVIPI